MSNPLLRMTGAYAGAGMPVGGAQQFCKPCLDAGHRCIALDLAWGDEPPKCSFCEDGLACPFLKRKATEHTRIPTSSEPMLRNDAQLAPAVLAKKRALPVVTVHAAKPEEFLKNGGKELIRAAVKEIAVSNELCKCGKPMKHRGRCKGTGGRAKLQRKAANPAAAHNSNGSGAGTLVVRESQIDHMFANWPLEDKVACVQAWLDREV